MANQENKTSNPIKNPRLYSLLKRPIMTEKSTVLQSDRNQYTFEVARGANKIEIKKAVEALFKVKVTAVNTAKIPGKMRRILGRPGMTSDWKKAIITVREGDAIDLV